MPLAPWGPVCPSPPLHHLTTLYFPNPKVLIILLHFSVGDIRHTCQNFVHVSERKLNSFIHSMIIFYLDAIRCPLDVSMAGDNF